MGGLGLFDDAVDALPLSRMEDPSLAQPEPDVRRLTSVRIVVGDDVARTGVGLVDGPEPRPFGTYRGASDGCVYRHHFEFGAVAVEHMFD
jgi:hypothetical protein